MFYTILFLVSVACVVAAVAWRLRREEAETPEGEHVFGTRVLVAAVGDSRKPSAEADREVYASVYRNVDLREAGEIDEVIPWVRTGSYQVVHLVANLLEGVEGDRSEPGRKFLEACREAGVRLVYFAEGHGRARYDEILAKVDRSPLNVVMTLDRRETFGEFLTDFLFRTAVNGRPLGEAWAQILPQSEGGLGSRQDYKEARAFFTKLLFAEKPTKDSVLVLTGGSAGDGPMAVFVPSDQEVTLLP